MSASPRSPRVHKEGSSLSSSRRIASSPLTKTETDRSEGTQHDDRVGVNWRLENFTQNLVSILNDPKSSKADSNIYYNDWGSTFVNAVCPPTNLPVVTLRDFENYLGTITDKKYSTLRRNRQTMSIARALREREVANANEVGTSQNDVKAIAKALEDVPTLFFKPNFQLEDPKTFEQVFCYAGSLENEEDERIHYAGLAHHIQAQELVNYGGNDTTSERSRDDESIVGQNGWVESRLSHYLDEVEQQLAVHIAKRSKSFFSCLLHQQDLHKDIKSACEQISTLKRNVRVADEKMSTNPLTVTRLYRRRTNCINLLNKLRMVSTLHRTQSTIQTILSSSDYVGALTMIDKATLTLTSELKTVHAFRHLGSQISEMKKLILKMVEAEFMTTTLSFVLNIASDDDDPTTTANERIGPLVEALLRAGVGRQGSAGAGVGVRSTAVNSNKGCNASAHGHNRKESEEGEISRHERVDGGAGANAGVSVGGSIQFLDQYRDSLYEAIRNRVKDCCVEFVRNLHRQRLGGIVCTGGDSEIAGLNPNGSGSGSGSSRAGVSVVIGKKSMTHSRNTSTGISTGVGASDERMTLTEQMRKMEFDVWIELMFQEFNMLNTVLSNVSIAHEVITNTTFKVLAGIAEAERMGTPLSGSLISITRSRSTTPNSSVQEGPTPIVVIEKNEYADSVMKVSSDIVCGASEVMHVRCAKLLQLRSDLLPKLSYEQFRRLYRIMSDFVSHTDESVPRSTPGLRGDVISMSKTFFANYHKRKKTQLQMYLDNERWVRSDVASEFQQSADSFREVNEVADTDAKEHPLVQRHPPHSTANHIDVAGEQFYVVGSLLMFLQMLQEYATCAADINIVSTDVLNCSIDLLQFYNSRVHQLILQAGAIELSGLKTITAKHLALSSQCLAVIQKFIPLVRSAISKNLTVKQRLLLSEFSRMEKDYAEHQAEIVRKIVDIMDAVHHRHIKTVQWNSPFDEETSVYMKNIVKEVTKLHRVLGTVLPNNQLNDIFSTILASMVDKFKLDYQNLNFANKDVQKRLLADVKYFTDQLSMLDRTKGPGHDLEKFVEERVYNANRVTS
eukprot:CFRG2294T1